MKKVFLFLVVITLLLPLVAVSCSDTEYHPGNSGDVQGSDLTILSHSMTIDEWGWPTVEGIARNDGNNRFDYAEIDVRFYNSDGHLIESSFTNILDLDPGQTWAFEVMGLTKDAVSYDIGVGDCW